MSRTRYPIHSTLWAVLAATQAGADESAGARLADAAMSRDITAVRSMIREGVDPDGRGSYGTPALLWLVRVGDVETAQMLIAAGANVNLKNAHGLAPLHLAVSNADLDMTRLLLMAGAEPDLEDGASETPLFIAARLGEAAIAEVLLDHGADVDRREPVFRQTSLHAAAREGRVAVARLLIARGANVEAQTAAVEAAPFRLPSENAGSKGVGIIRGGWPEHGMRYAVPGAKTPLLYATRRGNLELVRAIVEAGADIERPDANGITPLLNAIMNASVASRGSPTEHLAVVDYLLDRGADVNAVDWYGQTPLWAAVDLRNLDVAGPRIDNGIEREAVLRLIARLLDGGADVNARTLEYPPERRFIMRLGSLSWVDVTGQTPFLRAALAGDTTVMRLLVEHGADPGISTFGGTTPLMAAAGVNWVVNQTFDEGAEALLEAVELAHALGNDVDAANSMGLRAVHGAANRGSNEIIRFLGEHGARLDVADNEGRTPLVWAEGVFLATHPPVRKPDTITLIEALIAEGSP